MSAGWALESCSEVHGSSWEFVGVSWSRGKRKNVGVSSSLKPSQMAGHAGRKLEQKQGAQERCWPMSHVFPVGSEGKFKSGFAPLFF